MCYTCIKHVWLKVAPEVLAQQGNARATAALLDDFTQFASVLQSAACFDVKHSDGHANPLTFATAVVAEQMAASINGNLSPERMLRFLRQALRRMNTVEDLNPYGRAVIVGIEEIPNLLLQLNEMLLPITLGMPPIGFGTMEWPDDGSPHDPSAMEDCVALALEAGMTHFDCAESYTTTVHTGRAFAATTVPRESLWITTKMRGMPSSDEGYAAFRSRVVAHLADLHLSRADLILLHWPGPSGLDLDSGAAGVAAAAPWEWFDENIDAAWSMMNRLVDDGLCSHIGTSNFYPHHLRRLGAGSAPTSRAPFANEAFVDACHPQYELVEFCNARSIRTIAYRALCFVPVVEMVAAMGDTTAGELRAAALLMQQATAAAVGADAEEEEQAEGDVRHLILHWLSSRNIVPLVKSTSAAHLAANVRAALEGQASRISDGELRSAEERAARRTLFATRDMVDMCGGSDELAAAFEAIAGNAAEAAGAAAIAAVPPADVAALARAISVDE